MKVEWSPLHRGGGMIAKCIETATASYQFIISKDRSTKKYYLRFQYWKNEEVMRLRTKIVEPRITHDSAERVAEMSEGYIKNFINQGGLK